MTGVRRRPEEHRADRPGTAVGLRLDAGRTLGQADRHDPVATDPGRLAPGRLVLVGGQVGERLLDELQLVAVPPRGDEREAAL